MSESLQALAPAIRELCALSGVSSLSIGIVHYGKVIYRENYGYRDIENKIAPDSDTVYTLGSMTKGFTAEAVAVLVEEGKLTWETPVKKLLPEFNSRDNTIRDLSTVVDWMSHRVGIERADAFWSQCNRNILLSRSQAFPTINSLRAVTPFRASYRYTNWGFEIAGRVIEKLSGMSYSQFIREKIFEPLNMSHTYNQRDCNGYTNVAKGYMTQRDATNVEVPRPPQEEGTLINPAGGIASTVNDLLKYYSELMRSAEDQWASKSTATNGSPLKQIPMIFNAHMRTGLAQREQAYALGWARTQLPGALCDTSRNQLLLPDFPTIGDPARPRLAIYHHGMLVGFNNAVYLFPETQTAIILLSNSVALNDGPDLVGHMLIQSLFNDPERLDYLQLARDARDNHIAVYDRIEQQLKAEVDPSRPSRKPQAYTGTFYNLLGSFCITISEKNGELWMNFQGSQFENYKLTHLHDDEFSWYIPLDEQVNRGRSPIGYAEYWKIFFRGGKDDELVPQLFWVIEKDLPDGAEFNRKLNGANGHTEL